MDVEIVFDDVTDEVTLPKFKPVMSADRQDSLETETTHGSDSTQGCDRRRSGD